MWYISGRNLSSAGKRVIYFMVARSTKVCTRPGRGRNISYYSDREFTTCIENERITEEDGGHSTSSTLICFS